MSTEILTTPGRRRRLAAAGWSLGAQVVSKASLLFLTGAFAHARGVTATSVMLVALGSALIASVILDAGFSTWFTRVSSQGRSVDVWTVIATRLVLLPLTALFIGACQIRYSFTPITLLCMASYSVALFMSGATTAALVGQMKFSASAASLCAGRVITVVFAGMIVADPQLAKTADLLAVLCTGELLTAFVGRCSIVVGPKAAVTLGTLLRQTLPHAANSAMNVIYNRADVVMVSGFAGLTVAGLYGPASQVQNALSTVPIGLAITVLPMAASQDSEGGWKVMRASLRTGILASLAVGIICAATCAAWVPWLFGGAFRGSEGAVVVLALTLPVSAAAFVLSQFAIGRGQAGQVTVAISLAFAVTLVAQSVLGPRFGAIGAAFAAATREPIICGYLWAQMLRSRQRG